MVSKRDRDIHRLMDKPSGRRFAVEEAQCNRQSRGSNTKGGEAARDESKKFEVAPELMSVDTGSERPGRQREIRKETSECEVRAVLIWT